MNIRYFLYLLMAAALFACGPDPKPMVTTETSVSGVDFKHDDNVLRIALRQEPQGLNPVLTAQADARYVRELIFQTLNDQDPETFEIIPLLATIPDVRKESGGGVSYSYEINPEAKWPNGLPVSAADVIFSLKAIMNPDVESGPYKPYYYNIKSIITSPGNERRFRVMTRRPYLLARQAIASLVVYPEYAYDPDKRLRTVRLGDLTDEKSAARLKGKNEDLVAFAKEFNGVAMATEPDKIVGSGPYRLVSWEAGQRLTLDQRPDYWAKGSSKEELQGKPEQVIFEFIPDPQTTVNALRDEKIDFALNLSSGQFQELRDDDFLKQRFDFTTVPGTSYFGLTMNMREGFFKNKATRQAMAHLVDVNAIINQFFPNNLARRVHGPVLDGKDYYADLPHKDYDPDKALTLLTGAGWEDTNGDGTLDKEVRGTRQEFKFKFLTFPSPEAEGIGALMKEWMAEIGVEVEVVAMPGRALYDELNKGDFDMGLQGMGLDPNPDEFTQVWASTSVPPNGTNRTGFANAEADRLIKQIAVTVSDKDRDPMYRRFQEIIHEEQPMVFLISPATRMVVTKRFAYSTSPISPGVKFGAFEKRE
jgi:peptide/nickel transport system substrate-binding protein